MLTRVRPQHLIWWKVSLGPPLQKQHVNTNDMRRGQLQWWNVHSRRGGVTYENDGQIRRIKGKGILLGEDVIIWVDSRPTHNFTIGDLV